MWIDGMSRPRHSGDSRNPAGAEKLDSGFRRNDEIRCAESGQVVHVAAVPRRQGMIPRSRLLFEDEHKDEDDFQKVNLLGLPGQ